MSTLDQLEQLRAVVQAAYDAQQQSFQKILADEGKLRAEIDRLDQLDRAARGKVHDDLSMRALGSDVIWQGWVSRNKTEMNMKLAKVLAAKERHLAAVRKAYGKVLVVDDLIAETEKARRTALCARALQQAIDFSTMSDAISRR